MQLFPRSLFVVGVLLTTWAGNAQPTPPQVKTNAGIVEGKEAGPVRAFLGIPYAAPPVGDLRWKPPAPPANWTGVRKATDFGPRCMQARVYSDMIFRDPGISEDCLSLNVWAPAQSAQPLPVMVWIHGGGFTAGGTSEPRQDGSILSQQGVVVVSMNYRMGVFGFLAIPELAKESGHNSAGNYGLLDQVAALQWVQQNIAAFGGDPANVTIFGESAGSFSVSALMASSLAKGLFQKAIGESGAAFSRRGLSFDPLSTRVAHDTQLVTSTLKLKTLAALRAVSAQKLLDAFYKAGDDHNPFGADIDGYFLPQPAPAIFVAGKQNDVPLLAGWNHDEGNSDVATNPKPALKTLKSTAQKEFGRKSREFLRLYPATTDQQALRALEDFDGDRFIAWSTWRWMEAQSTTGKQPVYRYRFDQAPPVDSSSPDRGAYHSAEIEYVFGQLDSKIEIHWRPEDCQVSAQMQKYWANFARTGDPNGEGLPKWPLYGAASRWQVMYLADYADTHPEAHPETHSEARADDTRERYQFLTPFWEK